MKKILLLIGMALCYSVDAQIMVETITPEFDGSGGLNIGPDGMLYVANF